MGRRWLILASLLVAGVVLPACGGSEGETSSAVGAPSVSDEVVAPSDCAQSETGFAGSAQLETTGDFPMNANLCVMGAGTIAPDLGGFLFTWQGDESGVPSLTAGGPLETGTWPTSTDGPGAAVVTLVLRDGSTVESFVSNDGSCSVTVDVVNASSVSGSLVCEDLATSDASARVDVQATFEASET